METNAMPETNPEQHLFDMLADFSTAMLATRGADGVFHARPMAVAQLKPDMDVYFATDARSQKVAEMNQDAVVLVSFQSSAEFAHSAGRY
jgi:general stress protein 26